MPTEIFTVSSVSSFPLSARLGNKLHKLIFTTFGASNYGFYPLCKAYTQPYLTVPVEIVLVDLMPKTKNKATFYFLELFKEISRDSRSLFFSQIVTFRKE